MLQGSFQEQVCNSNNEGVEFRCDGLSTLNARTEYREVYFSKFIHLILRDCFSPILKVYHRHRLSLGWLSVTVSAMQRPSVVEGRITYIQVVAIHLPIPLGNCTLEVFFRLFRNGHLLKSLSKMAADCKTHSAHLSGAMVHGHPHGDGTGGIDGPVEIILMPGCLSCLGLLHQCLIVIYSHVIHSQELPSDVCEERVEDEGAGIRVNSPQISHLGKDGGVVIDPFLLIPFGGHIFHSLVHNLSEVLQLFLGQDVAQLDETPSLELLHLRWVYLIRLNHLVEDIMQGRIWVGNVMQINVGDDGWCSIEEAFAILRFLTRIDIEFRQYPHLNLTILNYIETNIQKWYCYFSMAFSLNREYFEVSFFISSGCGGNYYSSKICNPPNCYYSIYYLLPSPSSTCTLTTNYQGLLYSLISLCQRAPWEQALVRILGGMSE